MKKIIQTILSVGGIALALYMFTFGMDGEMGVIIIAFLLIAPLASLGFALYARNRITVSFNCDSYVKKGSELSIAVSVRKKGVFPLAVVEIIPMASEVFETPDKTYRLSLSSEESTQFKFAVRARVGGNGSVWIKSVYSCGFLGFMRFTVKTPLPEPFSVGVIPDIPDIKASSQLFRSIADVVMTSDEEEDSDTSRLYSVNTAPGYEHREYVRGDPLKRVNWKLSTKKAKLMVRLDEAVASVKPLIVLDLYRKSGADAKYAVITEEKLIRSVFGLLILLLNQGISCTFAYYGASGDAIVENIESPDIPEQLLLRVLSVTVVEGRRLNFTGMMSGSCACLAATTDAGQELAGIISELESTDSVSILGVSAESTNATGLPFWYLDDENNFKQV